MCHLTRSPLQLSLIGTAASRPGLRRHKRYCQICFQLPKYLTLTWQAGLAWSQLEDSSYARITTSPPTSSLTAYPSITVAEQQSPRNLNLLGWLVVWPSMTCLITKGVFDPNKSQTSSPTRTLGLHRIIFPLSVRQRQRPTVAMATDAVYLGLGALLSPPINHCHTSSFGKSELSGCKRPHACGFDCRGLVTYWTT